MNPVPPRIGQIRTTIARMKSGFNFMWPKYSLVLSDSQKFLLAGKKRSGQTTSNYVISADSDKMEKSPNGYLGKVRSNFLGTEFCLYDSGKNPKKAKSKDQTRTQQGVVQYETNVLGSKGPRRMKVLLPNVDLQGH
jgi:tubby-related protein 1